MRNGGRDHKFHAIFLFTQALDTFMYEKDEMFDDISRDSFHMPIRRQCQCQICVDGIFLKPFVSWSL